MRVYVAASSDELERARMAMDMVEAEGWDNALDWTATIKGAGGVANPATVDRATLAGWAIDAIQAIKHSDWLWLLAPNKGHARGAFFELGFAVSRCMHIAVSGQSLRCSIFTALADVESASDEQAVKMIEEFERGKR